MQAPAPEPIGESKALYGVLKFLPLMDDLFLRMQAQNIAMVNAHIIDIERSMYSKYMERDRTPVSEALFTSALSQMWLFSLYELLRTWRQRVQEVLTHAERFAKGKVPATVIPESPDYHTNLAYLHALVRAEKDSEFLEKMRKAKAVLEPVFRELEGVRVTLAKHEIPKRQCVKAANVGYARIDPLSGSMNYQYINKDGYSSVVSRHSIVQLILLAFEVASDDA